MNAPAVDPGVSTGGAVWIAGAVLLAFLAFLALGWVLARSSRPAPPTAEAAPDARPFRGMGHAEGLAMALDACMPSDRPLLTPPERVALRRIGRADLVYDDNIMRKLAQPPAAHVAPPVFWPCGMVPMSVHTRQQARP